MLNFSQKLTNSFATFLLFTPGNLELDSDDIKQAVNGGKTRVLLRPD
jgi:hypothetical protein